MVSAHIGGHDAHEDWGSRASPRLRMDIGIARGRERWLALPVVDVPPDPIRGIAFLDVPSG
jgi:hypothetical protein